NKGPEEVQRQSMLVGSDFSATLRPTIKTTTKMTTEIPHSKTKIIHDKNSDIHVITVGAQDQYDLQNSDQTSDLITQPRTLPTEVTPDDLYDEEELAKMDAEYAEQQKRQNRPIPAPESIQQQPIRVLPQEDEDVTEDNPDPEGEYFDSSAASATLNYLSSITFLLIFIRVL
uniref:Uncharacterized protein n=1 Tax=Panagrolaimus sp. ES5 TaxID=591445 RepID=A0AC34GGK4_9BILA